MKLHCLLGFMELVMNYVSSNVLLFMNFDLCYIGLGTEKDVILKQNSVDLS